MRLQSINQLSEHTIQAIQEFSLYVKGVNPNLKLIHWIYSEDALQLFVCFKDEWKSNLFEVADNKHKLSNLVRTVLFEFIVRNKLKLSALRDSLLNRKYQGDMIEALNDSNFSILQNGYLETISLIEREFMDEFSFSTAMQIQIPSKVSPSDFNLTGSYTKKVILKELAPSKERKHSGTGNLHYYFNSESDYRSVMKIMADKGYCHPITHIWQDQGSGKKGLLASFLKHLHLKDYYKDKKKLTNEEIVLIAQVTFGIDLKIDTAKQAKPDSFNFDYIPTAKS